MKLSKAKRRKRKEGLVTWLFYLLNCINVLVCFILTSFLLYHIQAFSFVLTPYLYFALRLLLYKIWYRLGYRPKEKKRSLRKMNLPDFVQVTDDYRQLRQQQSLGYQVLYNVYKVIYRSLLTGICAFVLLIATYSDFQLTLSKIAGGNESLMNGLVFISAMLASLIFYLVADWGKKVWQSHFFRRYPVKVLLIERDEPILAKI